MGSPSIDFQTYAYLSPVLQWLPYFPVRFHRAASAVERHGIFPVSSVYHSPSVAAGFPCPLEVRLLDLVLPEFE